MSKEPHSENTSIKDVASILAAVAGIAYTVGFLIVTGTLMSWGITDITLVKARYIAVGLLLILHITAITASVILLLRLFEEKPPAAQHAHPKDKRHRPSSEPGNVIGFVKRLLPFPVAFAGGAIVSGLVFYLTATSDASFFQAFRADWPWLLFAWYTPLFVGAIALQLLSQRVSSQPRKRAAILAAVVALLVLGSTKGYTKAIFFKTAPAVGGGDYFLVKLLPAHDKQKEFEALVARPSRGSNSAVSVLPNPSGVDVPWVWLLDQTDHAYFVLVLEGGCKTAFDGSVKRRAVEVSKDVVSGVVHYTDDFDLVNKTCE